MLPKLNRNMNIKVFRPTIQLKNYIDSYMIIKADEKTTKDIIPQTAFTLSFKLSGHHEYEINNNKGVINSSSITGLRREIKYNTLFAQTEIIIVKFQPLGAACFIHEPLHELSEVGTQPRDLSGWENIINIEDQLTELHSNLAKIKLIEQFLISKLKVYKLNPLTQAAVQKLLCTNSDIKINSLASSLNISVDALEKQFKRTVGMTPKKFELISRLTSVVEQGASMKIYRT
jgi:AraC-like DNA-binding protein